MIRNYPYLTDTKFLNAIYGQHNKTIYVNIVVLSWEEREIQEIQGQVISGSISVNGDSAVRRTANLSVKVTKESELYNNIDSLFSINKKMFLETGLANNLRHISDYEQYKNYPIIWFPHGTYVIQSCSVSHDNTGVTLSLSLNDKMCLLNGEAGGVIPASVNFESIDTLGPDGDLHTEYQRINSIIPEMVHHFGGESINKIIVNDIDNKIKQVLKWRGSNPLYLWSYHDIEEENNEQYFYTTINAPKDISADNWSKKKIIYNYDCGYTYTDFVYPGELTASPGDSVCTVLDKIKSTLGNYEYYYDVFGNFIFQEIKNYVNVSQWRSMYQQYFEHETDYLPYNYNTRLSNAVYHFDNSDFIISYNNNPQFNMIKNDFVVWGVRESSSGTKLPCRYHLAIDERPKLLEPFVFPFDLVFDTSMDDKIRRAYVIPPNNDEDDKYYTFNSLEELEEKYPQGKVGQYYRIRNNRTDPNPREGEDYDHKAFQIYTWVNDIDNYNNLLSNYIAQAKDENTPVSTLSSDDREIKSGYIKMSLATFYMAGTFSIPIDTDWRNILYFRGLLDSQQSLNNDESYYWAELCNEWPKIYNIEGKRYSIIDESEPEDETWIDGVLDSPSSLDWWFDIIDNDAALAKFSVKAIGRRSYSKTDNDCNCVFEPDIPDIVMVGPGETDYRSQMTQAELRELGLVPVQVQDAIYNSVVPGGTFNSCYQHIRQILTNYTNYNESISVTCLPIYHLEPNTRVFFNDPESGIYGEYIINSISYSLGNAATMSISARKVIEKI